MAPFVESQHKLLRQRQGLTTEFSGNRDEGVGLKASLVTRGFGLFPGVDVCSNPRFHVRPTHP